MTDRFRLHFPDSFLQLNTYVIEYFANIASIYEVVQIASSRIKMSPSFSNKQSINYVLPIDRCSAIPPNKVSIGK